MRRYAIVRQDRIAVTVITRTVDNRVRQVLGPGQTLVPDEIGMSTPLADICGGIRFE